MELIAVISIVAIMLSMVMALRTDSNKSDAMRVKAYLMQVKTSSYESDEIIPTDFANKYHNVVTPSQDLYFKKGVPVTSLGNPIIECTVRIIDNKETEEDIVITINTFTGKISFY